jgi:hypothetical protein
MTRNEDMIVTTILFVMASLAGGFLFHVGWNLLSLLWHMPA